MTSKIFGYKYQNDSQNDKYPVNTFLFIETPSKLYLVDADNPDTWLVSDDKGVTWDTVTTSSYNILSAYYDRDNGYIYYCGKQNNTPPTADRIYCYRIDISDDTIDSLGYALSSPNSDFLDADIFVTPQGVFLAVGHDFNIGVVYAIHIYEWDGDVTTDENWVLVDSDAIAATGENKYGVVIGDDYYVPIDTNGQVSMIFFDYSLSTVSVLSSTGAGYSFPNENLTGVSYDSINSIYFIVNKDTDSKNYLASYSISGDSWTINAEMDTGLMLDRNTDTSDYDSNNNRRESCFQREKGFDISTMKVYQIPRTYTGNLNFIANALRTQSSNTIVGITDSYLIVNNSGTYEVWKFVDIVAEGQISEDIDIIHPEREYPDCVLQWAKKANKYFDPPTKDQWIEIYGRYTSNTITEAYYHDSGGFNEETPGAITSADDMDWLDSITLYDGSLTLGDYLNHKNCLRLGDDTTGGEDPFFKHNQTQATSGIWEGYIGTSDVTEEWHIILHETGNAAIVKLRITTSKIQYYDSGDTWQDIQAVANDILYRTKIIWKATNKFDLYINETLKVDDVACNNVQVSGVDNFYVQAFGDSTDYFYLDAPGLIDENYYYEGKNLIKYDDNVIIFEGLTEKHNRNILTDVKAISRATELDSISPKVSDYTNYTGKTSGQIVDQLIDDFCHYITPGTISNGSNTYTCPDDIEFKGDKTLRTIINELADGEYFTWTLRPTGELDFDDGSVCSYVQILATHNSKLFNPYVTVLSEEYNQVIIYGRYISGAKVGPYTANNLASQQLHGILTWTKTYANQSDATILQEVADNKLLLQGNSPLIWEANREMGGVYEYGFVQPHETIYLEEGVLVGDATDETITSNEEGWYHLNVNQYDGLNDDSFLKLTDGLLFKENIQTTLPQQNSELIESLMGDGYATSQHNRETLFLRAVPSTGVTAGANNVYWTNGLIRFGATSNGNGWVYSKIILPDDYIDGEDITFTLWYSINASAATIDYDVLFQYANESTSYTAANNPTGQWTSNATANRPSKEELTITGTNLSAGDILRIKVMMDDNAATDTVALEGLQISIPVEGRT